MSNDSISSEPIYCFVDTNILIHRKTFDEVDWPRIVGADEACLVLAPTVLVELDMKKNDKNDWIQERARTLLQKLRPFIRGSVTSATISPHVTLNIIRQEPPADFLWGTHGLDQGWSDDRLLASLLQFRNEHPDAKVCFVTSDSGPMSKAVRLNIPLVEEELIDEVARTSTTAVELDRVRRELNELRNRMPKLEVGFWDQGKRMSFVTRQLQVRSDSAPTDEEIEARIADDTQKLKEMYDAGKLRISRVSEEKLEAFRREVDDYLHELTLALPMQRSRDFGPFTELQFVLVNQGSAPANDVILDLKFPDGSFVIGVSDARNRNGFLKDVELPQRPVAEWTITPKPRNPWSVGLDIPFIPPTLPYRPPPTGPRGPLYFEDRSMVRYRDTKFNQERRWLMEPVIVYLPPSITKGFPITWRLQVDELPKALTGKLNVKAEDNTSHKARG